MLNDKGRNAAYFYAIQAALRHHHQHHGRDAVVLDIGGGSGILSIYAARCGAAKVFCCEVQMT